MKSKAAGFGAALENNFDPFDKRAFESSMQRWLTFSYYHCERRDLDKEYVKETIRTDIPAPGVYVVSACKRSDLTKWLDKIFPYILWYSKRELIEIHVYQA